MNRTICIAFVLSSMASFPVHSVETFSVSDAVQDESGFRIHTVQSSYQSRETLIRVLLPDIVQKERTYPVIYILPVEAGLEKKYGDGLLEARQQNLHNALDAIFVAPTFSQLPWYADHPTSEEIRQESHFLKVVIPFVDKSYPVKLEASGRLLLGFSKSGWGAWSLLLRHPDKFGNGVAWDAPLMMSRPGLYGSGEIFGSVKNFENYRISRLLEDQSQPFQKQKRLILLGYGNFRTEHETTHSLLLKLNIPHEYRDGPERKHDWHSGWVKEAAESLFDKVEGTDAN